MNALRTVGLLGLVLIVGLWLGDLGGVTYGHAAGWDHGYAAGKQAGIAEAILNRKQSCEQPPLATLVKEIGK